MNITISLGLVGFGFKRGWLFGDREGAPITLLRCGLVSFVIVKSLRAAESYSDFLKANCALDEYLAIKRPRVRLAMKRAEAKARKQAQLETVASLDYWKQCHQEEFAMRVGLQQRVYRLETTVKMLTEMKEAG
ncbi:hypothetical protein ACOTF7_00845 [Achromobacter xylosoxidans]